MPNRDSTGPEGKGPGTGRGFGNCENTKNEEAQGRLGRNRKFQPGLVGRQNRLSGFGRRQRKSL